MKTKLFALDFRSRQLFYIEKLTIICDTKVGLALPSYKIVRHMSVIIHLLVRPAL